MTSARFFRLYKNSATGMDELMSIQSSQAFYFFVHPGKKMAGFMIPTGIHT
jgi:hypothetical protein